MWGFCLESKRARSFRRKLESFVPCWVNELCACVEPLYVYVMFPNMWLCALDLESCQPFLGTNVTRREQSVLAFLDLCACSLNVSPPKL